MLSLKSKLVAGAGLVTVLGAFLPAVASAQEPAAAAVEEVVVTGSRIATGFVTPTPVTTATATDLKAASPTNLADGLNQLPVFNGSGKTTQTTGGGLGGSAGQNVLNLRNLGSNRVLTLLDGRRVVSTNDAGSTNLDILPQNLVSRVDVVTGGASAAYGSDAVAGVVNLILDTRFEGLKGEIQGGVSRYRDSVSFGSSLAWGKQFLDGRLRVIASGEFQRQEGVGILDKPTGRKWYDVAAGQIPNPVTGATPTVIVVPDLKSATGSYGGLISSGPLRGTQFGANGQSQPFQYGFGPATYMSGGDALGGDPGNGLSPDQNRTNLFAYTELEVSDDLTLFADALYSRSRVEIDGALNFGVGSAGQLTIFRDNAYLPADILARMVAANVQSIPLGRYYLEFGPTRNESVIYVRRGSLGAKGKLPGDWVWDASAAVGQSRQKLAKNNLPILRNLFASSDAVRNASGTIVCRSTLTGFDPGCVPMNPFGLNSVSQAASDYITGDSYKELKLTQTVIAANVSGDLGERLQFGAGPISIGAGAEYRKEEANQDADAVSKTVVSLNGLRAGVAPTSIAGRLGPFQFYNPQPLAGTFSVKEAYTELGVPLLADKAFVKSFDLTLAGRYAKYSQSGGVKTWKYGFNYEVNDQVRFRYTKSRDIRGPSILELFNSQSQTNQTIVYKGVTTQNVINTSGNPDLQPERALTETYGVVYRPAWLPGFQTSLDRYKISITDAIGSLSAQQLADQCQAGNQLACSQFVVQSNGTLIFSVKPLNLSVEENSGYDFESAYAFQGLGGAMNVRLLVSHITDAFRIAPGSPPVVSLGGPGTPKWRGTLSATYNRDAWSIFLSERFIGKAKFDPTREEGSYTNDNSLPVIAYTNLTVRYKFRALESDNEAFLSISNLLDQKPPVSPGNPTSYNTPSNGAYDPMGRYFTVGLRFRR
jgi:iron complex outermembrane receptor protein